jgi:hypothetical protein
LVEKAILFGSFYRIFDAYSFLLFYCAFPYNRANRFNFFQEGSAPIYRWVYDTEPSWNLPGTFLEPSWNLPGTFLEPSWNLPGTFLKKIEMVWSVVWEGTQTNKQATSTQSTRNNDLHPVQG